MNQQLQDTILSFTQSTPRTIAEIADHIYITLQKHPDHKMTAKYMRHLAYIRMVKTVEKRRVGMTRCNQFLATTLEERIAMEESNRKLTTPSPAFSNDPIMAAFYSKVNI